MSRVAKSLDGTNTLYEVKRDTAATAANGKKRWYEELLLIENLSSLGRIVATERRDGAPKHFGMDNLDKARAALGLEKGA